MAQATGSLPSDPRDLLEIAWRWKWVILLPFLLIGGTGTFLAKVLPSVYRSSTVILVQKAKVPESYVKSTVTTRIEDRVATISQQILSRTRLEGIIRQFNLYAAERAAQPMEEVVERMRGAIEVQVRGVDSFTIFYRGHDPQIVRDVTNELAAVFIEENSKVREEQAASTSEFLESQLITLKDLLTEQESRVREFKQRHVGELPQQQEANLRALDRLQLESQSVALQLRSAEDRRLTLRSQLAATPRFYRDVAPVARRALGDESAVAPAAPEGDPSLARRLDEARTVLAQLEGRYTELHPDVIRVRRQVEDIEKRAASSSAMAKVIASPPAAAPSEQLPAGAETVQAQWRARLVDAVANVDGDVSIAVDGTGKAHLAYTDISNRRLRLRYASGSVSASQVSRGWTARTLGEGGGSTAVSVDSLNRPHVLYVGPYSGSANAIHSGVLNGSTWQIDSLKVPGVWEYRLSSVVDKSGVLAFTAYQRCVVGPSLCGAGESVYSAQLYLFTQNGGVARLIDPPGGQTGNNNPMYGKWHSLSLDPTSPGRFHVAYQVIDDFRGVQALKYTIWDGAGSPTLETIESGSVGQLAKAVKIRVDSRGIPHIAYMGNGGGVKYAWKDGASWHRYAVDPTPSRGESLALALDSADRPHLAYFDRAKARIIYATTGTPLTAASTGWTFEEVASGVTQKTDSRQQFIAITLAGSDPVVAYHATARNSMSAGARNLWVASRRPQTGDVEAAANQRSSSSDAQDQDDGKVLNPVYQQIEGQIAAAADEIKAFHDKESQISMQIRALQQRVENVPKLDQDLVELTRDYDNTRRTYESLLSKKLEAAVAENLEKRQKGEQFRVLDPASLPQTPYKPNRMLILALGLTLGLGTGVTGAAALEVLDHSLRSTRELRILVPKLLLIGTVPVIVDPKQAWRHRVATAGIALLVLAIGATAFAGAVRHRAGIARLGVFEILLR